MCSGQRFQLAPILRTLHSSRLKLALAFLARERRYELAISRFAPRQPGETYAPSVHKDRHLLCHILEGEGRLTCRVDGLPQRHRLTSGTLIRIAAGTPHDFA